MEVQGDFTRNSLIGTCPIYDDDDGGNALCFCCAQYASASRCFTNIKGLTCTVPLKNRYYCCPPFTVLGIEAPRSSAAQLCFCLSHPSKVRGLNRSRGKVGFCRLLSICSSSLHYIRVGLGRQTCPLRRTGGKIVINSSLIGIAVSNSA